jgi:hypothetical protein
MKFSNSIAHIASALSTFQAMVANVKKESTNPHFKSKYASLDEIITTIRPYMEKNGLSFIQNPVRADGYIGVSTIIIHKSGEFMEFDPVLIPLKQETAHQVGAAMTYARRYSLGAALGIATEEDNDGNDFKNATTNRTTDSPGKYQTKKTNNPLSNAWNKLIEENPQSKASLAQKRFFAICSKKKITDKQQKALVYLYSGKLSRKDLTSEEYMNINQHIQNATDQEIYQMIVQALKLFKKEA